MNEKWGLSGSWSWSYGSWIYNYLCNQYLSLLTLWFQIPLMARFFLGGPVSSWYNWNIIAGGIKRYNPSEWKMAGIQSCDMIIKKLGWQFFLFLMNHNSFSSIYFHLIIFIWSHHGTFSDLLFVHYPLCKYNVIRHYMIRSGFLKTSLNQKKELSLSLYSILTWFVQWRTQAWDFSWNLGLVSSS